MEVKREEAPKAGYFVTFNSEFLPKLMQAEQIFNMDMIAK